MKYFPKAKYRSTSLQHGGTAWLLILFLIALIAEGCARPGLRPAPEAEITPGKRKEAVAEASGVRMIAKGRGWSGNPTNLESILTTIQVTLQNQSGRPIQIRARQFVLVSPTGVRSAAFPPSKIQEVEEVPAIAPPMVPEFSHQRFYVAPYNLPYLGTEVIPWSDPFAADPVYYRQYYALWPVRIPTKEMFRKALREGVLEENGRLSGFLFFQKIERDTPRVTLHTDLIDAESGETIGTIRIPFVVD